MSRNGAGTYSLPAPPSPFVNGQTASATDMMTVLNDIASALTGSVAADGQTPMTGALNMNGQGITAAGAVAAASLTTTGAATVGNALTVTKGGATITAGGLTVSAGGATVTGNSTITGTLGGLTGLTVASGGATITGNSTITGTLGGLTGFTIASGGAGITGNSTVTGTLTVTGVATAANGTTGTQVVNFSQFPATLASTGTHTFPSGLIIKWGTGTYTAGVGTVTFAANFPTALLSVQCTLLTGGAAHSSSPPGPTPATYAVSGFTVYGGVGQSGSFSWLAIGH